MKPIFTVAMLFTFFEVFAQPGALLPTFGPGGKVTTDMGSNQDVINAIAVQPDGKVVAVGHTFTSRGRLDFALARYHPNGVLDTGFNGGGTVVTSVTPFDDGANAVAVQADGKLLVAGGCGGTAVRTAPRLCLVRYNANGSLDTAFGTGGSAFGNFTVYQPYAGRAVAVGANGKIWVGGSADNGADLDFALARFNADGSIDSGFNGVGYVHTPLDAASVDHAVCMAVQPDGKVLVGGAEFYPNLPVGTWRFAAVRYGPNGALDQSFANGGKFAFAFPDLANASAYALALQSDGKIVMAGGTDVRAGFGNNDFALLRLKANGAVDSSFGQDGVVLTDFTGGSDCAKAVRVGSDGRITAAGFASVLLNENVALARYAPDGAADSGFGAAGGVVVDHPHHEEAQSLAFSNGTLYTGGFALGGANHDFFLTAHATAVLSPLPLTFLSFAAAKMGGGVQLQWRTAGEENTAWFEVEQSADGNAFSTIGKVKAQGAGRTETLYNFSDDNARASLVYYRIKAVEKDGKANHSKIASVRFGNNGATTQLFPNPVKAILKMQTSLRGPLQIFVYDAAGRLVKRRMAQGNGKTVLVDAANLGAGTYWLAVKSAGATESLAFVKE